MNGFWIGAAAFRGGRSEASSTSDSARFNAAKLVRALGIQKRDRRLEQDIKVEEHAPILDVKKVVLDALPDLFLGIGLAAPAVDLRPSRDAGLHFVACEIAFDDFAVEMAFSL